VINGSQLLTQEEFMPRIKGQSDAASSFLRSFRTDPQGPPPENWPPPAVLRRWLRRPSFRAALASLQNTLQFQADFHLAFASAHAAGQAFSHPSSIENQKSKFENLQLLRLSHLRQRFAQAAPAGSEDSRFDDPPAAPPEREITRWDVLHTIHLLEPDMRLSKEELRDVAWRNGYPLPLKDFPDFPPPQPQDSFYYYLIMNPSALLWYFKLYGQQTGDYRHSPITSSCPQLIPKEYPNEPLPRFRQDCGKIPQPLATNS